MELNESTLYNQPSQQESSFTIMNAILHYIVKPWELVHWKKILWTCIRKIVSGGGER